MKSKTCPRCRQFRGRGFHRCPTATEPLPAPSGGLGGLYGSGGSYEATDGAEGATAAYGAAWEAFRAAQAHTPPPGRQSPAANTAAGAPYAGGALRFGRRWEAHGLVADALDRAHRALSTPVDTADGQVPFDAREVSEAVREVAERVHRHEPEEGEEPVYGPATRNWAVRVVNTPVLTVSDDRGVPRWVRPEVASLLTAVRQDQRAHGGLRAAGAVEAQRRVARAALADGLR